MIAITNTTLVGVVTQPRILYGMAREDVVPGVFAKIHPPRRSPWVGLLFSVIVVAALLVVGTLLTEARARPRDRPARHRDRGVPARSSTRSWSSSPRSSCGGQDEDERTFRANTAAAGASGWSATSAILA